MKKEYGWKAKGQRLYDNKSGNKKNKRITMIKEKSQNNFAAVFSAINLSNSLSDKSSINCKTNILRQASTLYPTLPTA